MQLYSTGPVVHFGVVQSTSNFGSRPKIGIYEHFFRNFIFLTNHYRIGDPTVVSSTLCHGVANKTVNVILAPEDPLNAWNVIPTQCQGAQGHFGSNRSDQSQYNTAVHCEIYVKIVFLDF